MRGALYSTADLARAVVAGSLLDVSQEAAHAGWTCPVMITPAAVVASGGDRQGTVRALVAGRVVASTSDGDRIRWPVVRGTLRAQIGGDDGHPVIVISAEE